MPSLATLLLALALASPGPAEELDAPFQDRFAPLEGTTPAQWRVVWTERPATEATISWSTREPGTEHLVRLRELEGPEAERVVRTHRDGVYTRHAKDSEPEASYHHARLTGLTPGTTYRFVLESDGVRSRELSFRTAPDDRRPFALLSGGDSRTGWDARCFINLAIAELVEEDDTVLALSHGGDYVFYGPSWRDWTRWLTHQELCTTASGRVLPIVPTRGNHDVGPIYDEVFDDPGGAGRDYFRTELAPGVSLLTLNSNVSVAGEQLEWLEAELAALAARDDTRWTFASYHAALYPAIKSPGPAKAFWPPLFERHGVDLVLESDGHAIKRTPPIRGDEVHPAGVVYVGEGGLGVPQREPRRDPWYLQEPGMVANGHHVIRLDVTDETLRVRFLRMGEVPPGVDPRDYAHVLPPGSPWRYLGADEAPSDWNAPGFDDSAWPLGPAGFGYGDDDDATVLDDMRRGYSRVHVRTSLDAGALVAAEELTLMCRYDDAFVAYLNGVEVARANVEDPTRPGRAPRLKTHEATELEAFPLTGWREHLRTENDGGNLLAIVGFNRMRTDADFTLDPWLAGERTRAPGLRIPPLETIDDTSIERRAR